MSAAIRELTAPWQATVLPLADRLGSAPVVEVRADDPWSEAGRKVLAGHLGRVLTRVPGVVAGEDPEEVHAMRVAARRMRAAMRVFGDAYERPITRTYLGELRAIGGRLGVVRDLDVWLGLLAADARRRSKRDRAGLRPLAAAWEAERAARHGELVAMLTSPWFAEVATALAAFVETPGAGVRPVLPRSPVIVRDRVPAVLWRHYLVVAAYGQDLHGLDVTTLHELRIQAKWLRYTLEFVREPLGPPATDLIRRVVSLQDGLGEIHDRHAAATSAMAFAADAARHDAAPIAVGRFIEDQTARIDRQRGRLGPSARGMMDAEYRRRFGLAMARL
jgi:CHAD domain-containing protein